jgi:ABC-type nitrate/sulfonate/bicarbonate transport system substrate-binding protein
LYTAWFATTSYAAANPSVMSNFQKALREAATYVNAHQAQTVDLIAQFTSVDPSIVRKMTRVEQGIGLDPAIVQPVIDAMARFQYIPAAFDARALLLRG